MKFLRLIIALGLLAAPASVAAQARVCGTRFVQQNRHLFPLPGAKILAPRQEEGEITVGTRLDFLVSGRFFLVAATCRYVGENVYIFVEDLQWEPDGGEVEQEHVDTLAELLERATPADPARGMYQLEVETFGAPPDVDGDERIFILILDTGESTLIGFFDPGVATHPDLELRRDAIFLDAVAVRRRSYLARGTLAHELQHLIHWGHDPDEEPWVDEGLSGYAEELTGYAEADPAAVPAFLAQPDTDLTEWHNQASSYGVTYLFMSFLAERYGSGLLRSLVAEGRNGIFGIDAMFGRSGLTSQFASVWSEWIAANYAAEGEHGYAALQGRRARSFLVPSLPFSGMEGAIAHRWGAINLLFRMAGSATVEFAGEEEGRYQVWIYAMRGGKGQLEQLALDDRNQGQAEVVEVDSLAIIVGRTSLLGGRFELAARELVIPTAVSAAMGRRLPQKPVLEAVYPNPFNGYALIPFILPAVEEVELSLYDVLGQKIRVLRQGIHPAGRYQVAWDGRDRAGNEVGSGTYLAVLRAGSERLVRGVSLVK